MKIDAYQIVTDRICELLEQGFIPWNRPWAMAATMAWSGQDGHAYSLLNQFMLSDPEKKYKSLDELFNDVAGEWVTFKQAIDRGGNVRKGEHGRRVVFFKMVPKKDENGDETNEVYPCITWSTVFKVSQCEGLEQKYHKDADALYDFNGDKTADEVASDYTTREGIKVNFVHGNKACYSPSSDTVTMPLPEQFQDSGEFYSTYFHELTHSTGHEKRLNRVKKNAAFGDEEYSTEELVAEIGACSLVATLGIENPASFRNSAGYIQNWLKALKNDKKMIVTATARAEKAIKMILNIKEEKRDADNH